VVSVQASKQQPRVAASPSRRTAPFNLTALALDVGSVSGLDWHALGSAAMSAHGPRCSTWRCNWGRPPFPLRCQLLIKPRLRTSGGQREVPGHTLAPLCTGPRGRRAAHRAEQGCPRTARVCTLRAEASHAGPVDSLLQTRTRHMPLALRAIISSRGSLTSPRCTLSLRTGGVLYKTLL
jgi:hypothetical protein